MRKLFVYLKEYRRESVLGPLFKMFEATLELIVPLIVAAIIDRGVGNADRGIVVRMCLVLVALGFVGMLFSVTAQFFAAKASVGFVTKLRAVLFRHIQRLSYKTQDEQGVSTLITRMTSDMNQVQTGLNLTLRLLLRSPFVVFGAMIMAFTVDAHAALWFVLVIPILSAAVFAVMLVCIPLYKKVQGLLDRVLGGTRETLSGVRVLRAFGKEDEEISSFAHKNDALTAMQKYVGRISALLNPVTYVILNLAVLGLIYTGAIRVQSGLLTQGAVVALYNYMSQILIELIKFANLILTVTKSVACARRIQSVLELPEAENAKQGLPAGDSTYRVEFRNAGLRYSETGEPALQDVNLCVRVGETVGVIGGTGSGKTSLVNLIPRFYEATEGQVFVDGQDVRSYDPAALRARIGVVPQKAVLFAGTIRDNLLWGCADASDDALLQAVRAAQAQDVLDQKGGLDGRIEPSGRNLSGGQRQRLTIARALVRRPDILILDDSASALDFATDAALRKALRALDYRPTVFIVSQRTSSIRFADRIVTLDEGRVAGIGTHDALLEKCAVYREIFDSQYRKEAKA